MINHKDFNYRASIDWIEFEINTKTSTNFQTIRRHAELNYVEAVDAGDGNAATTFKFRFYDIKNWQQVTNFFKRIEDDVSLANKAKVTGLEVSFDAFSKTQSIDDTKSHVAIFLMTFTNALASNPNHRAASKGKGTAKQIFLHTLNIRQVDSHTFYIGSQKDNDATMRIYHKTTDRKNSLPIEQQCARIEVTLKNSELPFTSVDDGLNYSFEKLASWFKFRKVIPQSNPLNQVLANRITQFGIREKRKVRDSGKVKYRLHHPLTKANIELNQIAYDKLRELTKRTKKKRVTRKSRVTRFKKAI